MNDLFKLNKAEAFSYEKSDGAWVSITIEMDLSKITYERTVMTLFDTLSEVGGLSGILVAFFALFMKAWNINQFDNMMAADLFKIKSETDDKNEADVLVPSWAPNFKDFFM